MIEKIISGGQTGVDQIGLIVGRKLGLQTGGTAPKGFRTEDGPNPKLAEYGLIESWSSDYPPRTEDNVRNSDATIWLGTNDSPGFKSTFGFIRKHSKLSISNPTYEIFMNFLRNNPHIRTLNVAGNRGSKLLKSQRTEYGKLLMTVIKDYNNLCTT